jgi:hypothetical protein
MPVRSHSEPNLDPKPPYPDWSEEMNHTVRDFADQMAPSDHAYASHRANANGALLARIGETGSVAMGRAAAAARHASRSARSVADELESFARRQPLSALAGALLIGVVLGMFSRRGA